MNIIGKILKSTLNKIDPSIIENTRVINRAFLDESADTVELSTLKKKGLRSALKEDLQKLYVGLDKHKVKHLEKLPLNEFLNESYQVLAKGMGIPEDLAPDVFMVDLGKAGMGYDIAAHKMFINNNRLKKNRVTLFSGLGHELEHCNQNFRVLRTESFGEKAIEKYSEIYTKWNVDNFINTFKNIPEEEISKLQQSGQLTDISANFAIKLKEAQKSGDGAVEEVAQALYNNDYPTTLDAWKEFRGKIIDKMGVIKAGSAEATDAEKYFDSFMQSMNKTEGKDYYLALTEMQAYKRQAGLYIEYMMAKYSRR